MQILTFEIASDGALVRGQHGAVYYLIRCLEAPAEMASTNKNVKLLMCIPGPKSASSNAVFWHIILCFFEFLGPQGM